MIARYDSPLGHTFRPFSMGPSIRASMRTGNSSPPLVFVSEMLKKRPGSVIYMAPCAGRGFWRGTTETVTCEKTLTALSSVPTSMSIDSNLRFIMVVRCFGVMFYKGAASTLPTFWRFSVFFCFWYSSNWRSRTAAREKSE